MLKGEKEMTEQPIFSVSDVSELLKNVVEGAFADVKCRARFLVQNVLLPDTFIFL